MKFTPKIINFDRFFELCFEAEFVEIGDHLVSDKEYAEDNSWVKLEIQTQPGLVTEVIFRKGFPFAAETNEGGAVVAKDSEGVENEIKFYVGKLIKA